MSTRKIALYARVSSAEQARPDKTSIGKQIDAGKLEVKRMRLHGEAEVVVEYRDEGVSGTVPFEDRPEGRKLLAAAKAEDFDTVVFYSMDRFTRSATTGLNDFELMEDDLGLTIILTKENVDTSQPSGKLFRTILAGFAEFERDQIAARNKAGKEGAIERARNADTGQIDRWVGGQLPYGYRSDGEGFRVEIDPEAERAILRVFELRAEGLGQNRIAEAMQKDGFTTRPRRPAGKPGVDPVPGRFNKELVGRILREQAYIGKGIEREGEVYTAPAIVNPGLFEAGQRKPNRTTSYIPKAERASFPYALSQRITHVHDDGTTSGMFGQALTRSAGPTRYYRCHASRRDGNREAF